MTTIDRIIIGVVAGLLIAISSHFNHIDQSTKATACYLLNQHSTNPTALQDCLSDA